ncbi:protein bark beetle [Aplysia californica]|uniref:Protein bark beetle n=1 Tax=Aplysia californica TaxID=6500 RepID=A0ABM1ACV6_APLCA|nr:protein bark beetle [Aplysia californica]
MGSSGGFHTWAVMLPGAVAFLIWLSVFVPPTSGQITPPPNINNRPTIANDRIYFLEHIPKKCQPPLITTFPGGGIIKDGSRALLKSASPHIIKGNIEIAPSGCLYIEPGSVLKFAPGVGMIINGTLIARGSEEEGGRIVMTKMDGPYNGRPSGDWQDDARLSMGNTTRDGRLDLKYKNRWRAICTNYNNFTEIDANVTCRHLGFLKGNFTYHSFSRNLTEYILWEKPDCKGGENSLFDCPGVQNIKTGHHICDGQEVVGFECEGLRPGLALDHWRGLDFYNSTTETRIQPNTYNNVHMKESLSFLEYLDISYTGLDFYHGRSAEPGIYYQKAAISASPHIPMMNNVTIRYGAYDALNFTEIVGPILVTNCSISQNRGYGMFIQSSIGHTLINMTEVNNNWGDGIKFYISNLTIFDFRRKFPPHLSFCASSNFEGRTFPYYEHMDLIQVNGDKLTSEAVGGYCSRTFKTKKEMKISVHFLIIERDPDASGFFEFSDGGAFGKMTRMDINNGTFPQSMTTETSILNVKFKYNRPRDMVCKTFPPCIRFLLEFTSDTGPAQDFRLIMSSVHNNTGYGVNVQDMRSKMVISNETIIADNQFGAGVRVYRGAGEIVINGTRVFRNADAGVNITYSGGYQLFNNSAFEENFGYGIITEYLKLNHTRIEKENKIEVVKANFTWNELIGLRMGNYCSGADIKVNESYFAYNWDEAFEYLSCNITTMLSNNLRIEFNSFESNFRHAIVMRPLLNTKGIITNCTFENHSLGVIRVDNGYDLLISRWYRDFPVDFNLFENTFTGNTGRYVVNFRLTQYSAVQKLFCKFNFFQGNTFNNSFDYLNPRSRANAVAVLSSGNVQFRRNYMDNSDSLREIATHSVDPSVNIDAKENYWAQEINRQSDYARIYAAIFDQDDRYNLAKVVFHPALKTSRLYEDSSLANDVPEYVWTFVRPENTIGGVMENKLVTLQRGQTYYVDRDIYIFKKTTLVVEPDCTLKFAPSVGMVVHGILIADGGKTTTPVNFDLDDSEEFVPMENRTASVRLVDGRDEFEGRLEVEIDGEWGTVCNHGWIEEDSLLACQQLGLSFDRDHPEARSKVPAPVNYRILMSWVSCDDVDTDLTKCRAVNQDAHSCTHDDDVYLRCQPPTWAGITLAAAMSTDQEQPRISQTVIRFATIKKAGLLDPDTATLTPALRIDYNFYKISWLTVENSISDGISIAYSHPYSENVMEYLKVLGSAGNGIVTKSPRLELWHSKIDHSGKAGFLYDPFFTEYDALLIRNMIYPDRRVFMLDGKYHVSGQLYRVRLPAIDDHIFLLCPAGQANVTRDYFVEVQAYRSGYRMVLQIMDYLPVESVEKVTVYDTVYQNILGQGVKKWEIEKDLVDFPVVSGGDTVTIKLSVNGQLSGRLAFVIVATDATPKPVTLKTRVFNTTFDFNDQGIVTKHYNNPSNLRLELFHRHKEEEISLEDVLVRQSLSHAVHMPSVTKFHEDYIPTYEDMTRPERVAKVNYTIFRSSFIGNVKCILAEHNHVDFANNVWHWNLREVLVEECSEGGLEIEVPRVNDESERETHAVLVEDSKFWKNGDFRFTIAGYYAVVGINRNTFTKNLCSLGLISITGMEKDFTMMSNAITNNAGRFMMNMNILGHSEYSPQVTGDMALNKIVDNSPNVLSELSHHTPSTYAVAVRGLQKIGGYRNLFDNKDLEYELVAGIETLYLDTHVNFTYNYWGYSDETTIRKRIFDFDDWNNYVIADYFPYLTLKDVTSAAAVGSPAEIILDPSSLGGRVEKSVTLIDIGKPYIVESDLTVMPGYTLTIPPGTELQFRPNVGILVLGRLVANGLPFGRIKMRPFDTTLVDPFASHRITRHAGGGGRTSEIANVRLRGDGTLFHNAGFLELYNASSHSWNMMCDSQFNEKTAEVVCRELGKETVNVKVRFTHLYDYYIFGKPMYFRKEFWFNKYHCRGDETSLNQCTTRYNYNLLPCIFAANYTFITCGDRNLEPELQYWGNIRFAKKSFEEQPLEADIGKDQSIMSYVDIEGAGMLHGEKVGAIQTTYVTPEFKYINITKCAENGFDIVAPRQPLVLEHQNVTGNLGYGINVLVLNGESSIRRSSFLPNGPSTIPYNVYGLVDICRMEKEIQLETRLILFYKYGPNNRDCVKIISSRKTIGLRFLQLNLFQEDFSRNVIQIFDGMDIRLENRLGNIMANSSQDEIQQIYQSTGSTMSVHVHASVSHGSYGFIAEVVRLPPTGLTYPNSEVTHLVEQSEIRGNEDGAIQYKSVGETNPSLYIQHCWISANGYPVLNLTSPPSIDLSLQSVISFRFSHNQVTHNKGGMYLFAHTSAINSALRGNMTNNVFAFGSHGEALNVSGHYFERLMLHQNYFYNYTAGDYRDIIHVKDVVVNFTHCYMLRNLGHYIVHTYDSDDSTQSQLFARNGIYDNNATALRESTIKVGSGRPKFENNFLVNNLNDFEMESYPKELSLGQDISAKNNWWGSERRAFISGKTYDNFDNKDLVEIDYWPPIIDSRSIIEGDCLPGWVLDKNRCFRYMGGALPFEEAKLFCQSHGAFLAEARDREGFFNYLIRLMVSDMDWSTRVWVMSGAGSDRCSALEVQNIVYEQDCARRYYPFICETDPYVEIPEELASSIQAMIIGICAGVGGVIIIIIVVIAILWSMKSKRREKERFERTASIRSSLNNLTKINGSLRGTKSSLIMLSEGHSRRRLNELDARSLDSSLTKNSSSAVSNGISGSVHSLRSDSEVDGEPEPAPARPDYSRQVHSLRPDRSGGRNRPVARVEDRERETNRERERQDRERERMERERRLRDAGRRPYNYSQRDEDDDEKRGEYKENSDDDSIRKESDDEYYDDISFDDDEEEGEQDVKGENRGQDADEVDAKYLHYRVNRSQEHLSERPPLGAAAAHPGFGARGKSRSRDNLSGSEAKAGPLPHKSKSLSSFAQPDDSMNNPVKPNFPPPRSSSRDNLPTPPPDPHFVGPSSDQNRRYQPRPAPRPKHIRPHDGALRDDVSGVSSVTSGRDGYAPGHSPAPAPRQRSLGSQEILYNNEPGPRQPAYDPSDRASERSGPLYYNMQGPTGDSRKGPLYDPVYGGSGSLRSSQGLLYDPVYEGSDRSRSTNRYEPVDYSPTDPNPYGKDQIPDSDYMPRPLSNPTIGRSRERLGPPTPAPLPKPSHFRQPLESDLDSYAPSIQSDVDYMPRKYQPSVNDRFNDPLPPKPGASYTPETSTFSNRPRTRGSREDLVSLPQPPPYSQDIGRPVRPSASRDRLDLGPPSFHSSSVSEEPPPYSPGEELMPSRHRGSTDMLYLGGRGARPKHSEPVETEI